MTQILQQQIFSDGTVTWNLIDSSQTFTDSATATAYLQTLGPGVFMAQVVGCPSTAIIAEVAN